MYDKQSNQQNIIIILIYNILLVIQIEHNNLAKIQKKALSLELNERFAFLF